MISLFKIAADVLSTRMNDKLQKWCAIWSDAKNAS